jgi:hypothetical protein
MAARDLCPGVRGGGRRPGPRPRRLLEVQGRRTPGKADRVPYLQAQGASPGVVPDSEQAEEGLAEHSCRLRPSPLDHASVHRCRQGRRGHSPTAAASPPGLRRCSEGPDLVRHGLPAPEQVGDRPQRRGPRPAPGDSAPTKGRHRPGRLRRNRPRPVGLAGRRRRRWHRSGSTPTSPTARPCAA